MAVGFVLAVVVAVLAFRTGSIAGSRRPLPEDQVTFRPVQAAGDGYVSSETCRACHPSQYASWYASYHRTMTQVATGASVRADFDNVRVAAVRGDPMQLTRRGDELWAEFDDPDSKAAARPTPRISRQVVLATGSHQQQAYWYRTDHSRLVGQLPGVYLIDERRWLPRRSVFLRPPSDRQLSETGRWNDVCINCHTTHGKRAFAAPFNAQAGTTQTADTTVAEFGIACEACHGPAASHVATNRNPMRRYSLHLTRAADTTIVHPLRLDPRRSSQVCGQCHSVWEFEGSVQERQANWNGFPYRPGDDLRQSRFLAQPTANIEAPTMQRLLAAYPGYVRDAFWSDGMIRVSGREYNGLIESPCFKNATDDRHTLSCFSCHTMHKTPSDPRPAAEWADTHQVSAGREDNEACLQCHTAMRSAIADHTRHRADSGGSSCYNCHMPYTTYGLLRGLRSHQISSPSVAASVSTGRPNACNACHLDRSLAWTEDYLAKWYKAKPVALDTAQQSTAASLLWLLRGDAGQRALMAWAMSWRPARDASGSDWMAPFVSLLLDDPYDAVRVVAERSLRSLPGYATFDYDPLAPSAKRMADGTRAVAQWRGTRGPSRRGPSALLFGVDGDLDVEAIGRLLRQRDDRPLNLRE